jgi:hypothetical protein
MNLVLVADVFFEDLRGGAESALEALLEVAPCPVARLRCTEVTDEAIARHRGAHRLFGNYSQLDLNRFMASGERYSVIEFDYKFCELRSMQRHFKRCCPCASLPHGQRVLAFLRGARHAWFMSEPQRRSHYRRCPELERTSSVLSAPMFAATLRRLRELRREPRLRSGWGMYDSPYWLKGTERSLQWCAETGREPVRLGHMPYDQLLDTLGRLEGLVHLPRGADTCPLLVTEAKLAGCAIHVNELVQHAREPWFDTADLDAVDEYVTAIPTRFWQRVTSPQPSDGDDPAR